MISRDRKPQLIDRGFVLAFDPDGKGHPETRAVPKAGYLFADLTPPDVQGKSFAYCAYPAEYDRTGRQTFIIDQTGNVYGRDLGMIHFAESCKPEISDRAEAQRLLKLILEFVREGKKPVSGFIDYLRATYRDISTRGAGIPEGGAA